MNHFTTIPCLLTILLTILPTSAHVSIGDEICIAGYIMDTFCIHRGTLLDANHIRTLSSIGPLQHSIHCLIDVTQCRTSDYEVLQQTDTGDFGRAWRIHNKTSIVTHARSIGACSTCVNGYDSGQRMGYRVTLKAQVMSLGGDDVPAIIDVHSIHDFDSFDSLCVDVKTPDPPMILGAGSAATRYQKKVRIHGGLMVVGWGFLIPTGALIARFGKHRPNAWWYKIHRVLQPVGLIIGVVSWVIALINFDALSSPSHGGGGCYLGYPHAVCGMITMVLGLFQPFNAVFRPHPQTTGEPKRLVRLLWEICHKLVGWCAIGLAASTIGIGITLVTPDDQFIFRLCYGLIAGLMVLLVVWLCVEERSYGRRVIVTTNDLDLDEEKEEEIEVGDTTECGPLTRDERSSEARCRVNRA